jgi:GntR family transcriptional regulator
MLKRTPIYLQIQEFVREGIRSGRFAEGERLPSEPQFARRFQTTRATVARAFHDLSHEGLVDRRIGSGTYVGRGEIGDRLDTTAFESHEEHVLARGETLEYRVLRFTREAARREVAAQLGVARGEAVYRLERLRLVAGRPLAVEVRALPSDIAEGIRRDWLAESTIQAVLQNYLGLRIESMENAIRAATATARIARALGVAQSSPVLVRAHTIRGYSGRPLVAGETFYPSHFAIRYTLHAP